MYLMTPDEAAKELKVSPETLRRWLRTGTFKAAKTPAGWRISENDLEQFISARHTGQPQAQRNALGNLQPLARRGGAKGGGTMGRPGGGNVGTAGTNAAQAGQGMRPDRSPAGLTGI